MTKGIAATLRKRRQRGEGIDARGQRVAVNGDGPEGVVLMEEHLPVEEEAALGIVDVVGGFEGAVGGDGDPEIGVDLDGPLADVEHQLLGERLAAPVVWQRTWQVGPLPPCA